MSEAGGGATSLETKGADAKAARALSIVSFPLLVDAADAATLCKYSVDRWRQLDRNGATPKPVRVGGGDPRWSYAELEQWIAAGCPDRAEWEDLKRALKGRR